MKHRYRSRPLATCAQEPGFHLGCLTTPRLSLAITATPLPALRPRVLDNRERSNGTGKSHRRGASRGMEIPAPASRPGLMPSGDSTSGSMFDVQSPGRASHSRRASNGHVPGAPPVERSRRRNRNTSMGNGDGSSMVAAAVAGGGAGWAQAVEAGMSFKDTSDTMEDNERETLLSLLTGAYSQVRVCVCVKKARGLMILHVQYV